MSLKTWKEILPLIASCTVVLLVGIIFFSFTKADAALVIDEISPPLGKEESGEPIGEGEDESVAERKEELESAITTAPYMSAGETVAIDGLFLNDIFVAGNNVTVRGKVEGDVFAAGANVAIDAVVDGDVRVAGGTVTISNAVTGGVTIFGGQVNITENTDIGRSLTVYAADATMGGRVGTDIYGSAETFTITGEIENDVNLDSVDELTIKESASIGGNLTYSSKTPGRIASNAVTGDTIFTKLEAKQARVPEQPRPSWSGWFFAKLVIGLLGYLLLGFLAIKFFPRRTKDIADFMRSNVAKTFGFGILYLLITPLLLIVVFITIVGIPLAMVASLLFLLTIFFAKINAGLAFGQLLLSKSRSPFFQFFLGFSILYVAIKILDRVGGALEFLGLLVLFVALAWACGGMIAQLKKSPHG